MSLGALSWTVNVKDEATKQLENIRKKIGEVDKDTNEKTKKMSEGFINVGKAMMTTGVAITGAVSGIVMAGSKWSAEVAGTQFLYDNLDKSIQKTISSNSRHAQSIGLTSQQYKNSATTIATYYKNMGMTTQETAKLSASSMDLVADLRAITDMPFDEAMNRFKSGLMGNYEALDAFGINISARTLENSEYVKSLGKSWNQLSDNEKMMAVYNEIVRQSSSAQGLAKQEAQSFGMQMKLLGQKIRETAGAIGEKLLPYLEPLVQKISGVVEKIGEFANANPRLMATILAVVGAIGVLMMTIAPVLIAIGMLGTRATALNVAFLPFTATILGVVAGIGLLIFLGYSLVSCWNDIKLACTGVWDAIKQFIITCCQLIQQMVVSIWNGIKAFLTMIWNVIKTVASTVWNGIKTVITTIMNVIKTVITTVWNAIKSVITTVLNAIKSVISAGFNAIKTIITTIWNGIKTAITTIINAIKMLVTAWVNNLKNIINSLKSIVNVVKSIWDGVKNAIKSAIDNAVNVVKNGVNRLKSLMHFKWSLPKLKLPHFSVSGKFSLNPPSVPHFGVSWYNKGGIFTKPTLLGNIGVGDANRGMGNQAEAVLPIGNLRTYIREEMANVIGNNPFDYKLIKLAFTEAIKETGIGDIDIILDGRKVARGLSKYQDENEKYKHRKVGV